MKDIIMSIKARHIQDMRQGVKRYELRKSRPADFRYDYRYTTVWLCESGTGGRIVASFLCNTYSEMVADNKKVAELAHITEEEVREYREKGNGLLFGWRIENFKYFKDTDQEKHIADFGLTRPPQSWCFAKE